jgi:hypothetical protein
MVKALPAHQQQRLAVVRRQRRQRGAQVRSLDHSGGVVRDVHGGRGEMARDPARQAELPPARSPLVGQTVVGRPVEPGQRVVRQPADVPPSRGERLRDDVLRVPLVGPAQGVRQDPRVISPEHRREPICVVLIAHL